ncbi:hypothetical protein [Chryseobacterium paridis]|uniref:Uncharacterized protein n=1 Tax=Chryseobacterium paridis TaxID=2800328 RepID=A0ABS1FZX4_9FLAO|nr:hypothetical protein [Chryseobacterium paridis]MBK1897999.1 hypothetical protein [Chryseobacterium paridis]
MSIVINPIPLMIKQPIRTANDNIPKSPPGKCKKPTAQSASQIVRIVMAANVNKLLIKIFFIYEN